MYREGMTDDEIMEELVRPVKPIVCNFSIILMHLFSVSQEWISLHPVNENSGWYFIAVMNLPNKNEIFRKDGDRWLLWSSCHSLPRWFWNSLSISLPTIQIDVEITFNNKLISRCVKQILVIFQDHLHNFYFTFSTLLFVY